MPVMGDDFQVLRLECHEPWLASRLAFDDAAAVVLREFPPGPVIAMPTEIGYLCPKCAHRDDQET